MRTEHYRAKDRDAGKTLVDFLSERMKRSKRKAKALLDRRRVYVNRQRVWMAKHRLAGGDAVEVQVDHSGGQESRRDMNPPILYSDDALLVVSKPPGMLTQGTRSVEAVLRSESGIGSLAAVHRLDRDTSGCLLFAKDARTRDLLIDLFRERRVRKQYLAIVHGRYTRAKKSIEKRVDGKAAATRLSVVEANKRASLLRCEIETGRTHQIRKHLAAVGNPVAGDKRYGPKMVPEAVFRELPRQMLHAAELEFVHPQTGATVHCTAPLPHDFKQAARQLNLRARGGRVPRRADCRR